ncbi:type IV secretion system protein [Caballeronia sp. GAWG2-1]|uniref:type IV secretion system protein n=2 Tax=Caballeronia TaxID=1827195 RepID=UPI002027C803|nr:type IV secretion system protein [Caballeronia sp. GAWG2-1]
MAQSLMGTLRTVVLLLATIVAMVIFQTGAFAQAANASPSSATDAGTAALASPDGDFGKGAQTAVTQIDSLVGNLIPNAITASSGVMDEANKFAWGLGVISLVLVGVRFAGTHHPISAWVNLFEEVAVLGIFVALYLGYTSSASGFWTWFKDLAAHISGASDSSTGGQMAHLAGVIFDGLKEKLKSIRILNIPAVLSDAAVMLLAAFFMCLAAIVFIYYSAVGQIQSAIGIVLGPIAIALAFSSYTRNYFVKWLDWMISAGMYVVVVAILMKLVGSSIGDAVSKASGVGGATTVNAMYVFNLAIFILLLSLEIPKLAAIFGGGASATGTAALKLAKGFIP